MNISYSDVYKDVIFISICVYNFCNVLQCPYIINSLLYINVYNTDSL